MRRWAWPALLASLIAGAVLVVAPSAQADPATTISIEGEVVTITVRVDAPGATRKDAKKWADDAETVWNEAFARWPYKCVKLHVEVQVTPQPETFEGRSDHHRIFRSRGGLGVVLKPHGDTTYPLEHALDGAWGDLPEAGFAHEVGHLMGLGDDYDVVSEHPWRTKPRPGREYTLMGDDRPGTKVDKALVDRLGALLAAALKNAGKSLPSCWTGVIHSAASVDTRLAGRHLHAAATYETTLTFTVAGDGTISGSGTAELASGHCNLNSSDTTATEITFEISGTARQDRLELNWTFTGVTPARGQACGFGIRFMEVAPRLHRPLIVPITADGVAQGQATEHLQQSIAEYNATHAVQLTCPDCQRRVG